MIDRIVASLSGTLSSPETVARLVGGLAQSLGLTPDQLQALVRTVIAEAAAFQADRLGFKAGAPAVVAELRGEIAALHAKIDALTAALAAEPEGSENVGSIECINGRA